MKLLKIVLLLILISTSKGYGSSSGSFIDELVNDITYMVNRVSHKVNNNEFEFQDLEDTLEYLSQESFVKGKNKQLEPKTTSKQKGLKSCKQEIPQFFQSRPEENQIFLTDIDHVCPNLDKTFLHNRKLKLKPTSGYGNNCLLFSIFQDKNLLTRVLCKGNSDFSLYEEIAEAILSAPEYPFSENREQRDLFMVREKIFRDIEDACTDQKEYEVINSGDTSCIEHCVNSIRQNKENDIYQGLTNQQYLSHKAMDQSLIDIEFADIIAVLYKIPLYIFQPYPEDTEVKLEDSALNPSNRLNLINGTYFKIPNGSKEEAVFVHHPGYRGAHYSRLIPVD